MIVARSLPSPYRIVIPRIGVGGELVKLVAGQTLDERLDTRVGRPRTIR